ncbi:hypothetical protein ACFE04_007860 [Oxalis oulophora]
MVWRKENLDIVLVPSGLLVMSVYHLFLLYRIVKLPQTTIIGYEKQNKKAWVAKMLQVDAKDRGLALTVLNTNITAANFMCTTSLALSTLIGTWFHNNSYKVIKSGFVYGNTSSLTLSIKYISLIICFFIAFGSFVQCIRNFVHVIYLISMPNANIPVWYVQRAVTRGSDWWSFGLRAIYFATVLLLWIFGPIPMFVSSVIMVGGLYILDDNKMPLQEFDQLVEKRDLFGMIDEEVMDGEKIAEHRELFRGDSSRTSSSQ